MSKLNEIVAAVENLGALTSAAIEFERACQVTQEFTDPGSTVAGSFSCSAADAFEELLSALGLEIMASDFKAAHLKADDGEFGYYHAHWEGYEAALSQPAPK